MTTGPTWYEILGVERDASAAQIKAAWRAATDKFEPGSGQSQFRLFNEAADVLLDPQRREEYDAQLAGTSTITATPRAREPETTAKTKTKREKAAPAVDTGRETATETGPEADGTQDLDELAGSRRPPVQVLFLGLAALALLVSAVFAVLIAQRADDAGIGFIEGVTQGDAVSRQEAGTSAMAAAERALAAALSYDYRRMEADRERALGFMTPGYGKDFAETFDKLLTAAEAGQPNNVVKTKTVVKATVVQAGVMNPSAATTDKVRVLAYVNQSATKGEAAPTIFQNRVAVTMVERDGEWLIDGLTSY